MCSGRASRRARVPWLLSLTVTRRQGTCGTPVTQCRCRARGQGPDPGGRRTAHAWLTSGTVQVQYLRARSRSAPQADRTSSGGRRRSGRSCAWSASPTESVAQSTVTESETPSTERESVAQSAVTESKTQSTETEGVTQSTGGPGVERRTIPQRKCSSFSENPKPRTLEKTNPNKSQFRV